MSSRQFDAASELEMAERETAIEKARMRMAGAGAAICRDCSEPIPRERRLAVPSAVRCIDCETLRELRARRR